MSGFRINISYPSKEGLGIDTRYYLESHLPLVREKVGDALLRDEVWIGISVGDEKIPPPILLSAQLYFESAESFEKAFLPHSPLFREDRLKFTDIEPIVSREEFARDAQTART